MKETLTVCFTFFFLFDLGNALWKDFFKRKNLVILKLLYTHPSTPVATHTLFNHDECARSAHYRECVWKVHIFPASGCSLSLISTPAWIHFLIPWEGSCGLGGGHSRPRTCWLSLMFTSRVPVALPSLSYTSTVCKVQFARSTRWWRHGPD